MEVIPSSVTDFWFYKQRLIFCKNLENIMFYEKVYVQHTEIYWYHLMLPTHKAADLYNTGKALLTYRPNMLELRIKL